jgi:hypothetical protein
MYTFSKKKQHMYTFSKKKQHMYTFSKMEHIFFLMLQKSNQMGHVSILIVNF